MINALAPVLAGFGLIFGGHHHAPPPPAPLAPVHHVAAPQTTVQHHEAKAHKLAAPHLAHHHGTGRKHDYTIYDSTMPWLAPSSAPVAVYATGPYAATEAQASAHSSHLWIDTQGGDPKASALDVEPGDATPSEALTWARARLAHKRVVATIYTDKGEWGATKAALNNLPGSEKPRVKWWIADPTGSPHIVPGADATQWSWTHSYDISMAKPGFGVAP